LLEILPACTGTNFEGSRKRRQQEGQPGFLLVEGGRIDPSGHANDIHRNVLETIEFDNTVQVALPGVSGRAVPVTFSEQREDAAPHKPLEAASP